MVVEEESEDNTEGPNKNVVVFGIIIAAAIVSHLSSLSSAPWFPTQLISKHIYYMEKTKLTPVLCQLHDTGYWLNLAYFMKINFN